MKNKTSQRLERKEGPGGREVRSYALQLKATGDDGTVEGYGSVFGERDSYDDVIAPGAFKGSLAAHKAVGTMPAMLWQHDGAKPIGIWTEMVEDSKGLRIKGQLALETVLGKEAHALLKLGALNGLSIGFVSKQWTYDRDTDVRTLTELDLWEVSLVTFPANGKARVTNVKAADDLAVPKDAERLLRDAGFSKSDATAFVSRVMRMGEARRESADSTAAAMRAADRLLLSLQS
ncbi:MULTISPECIES: HK97 family phage prohead protease [Delftia]|uniref:HK97 family phage prohead protease n=2 Tax=Pseudomonadota TaxID=1224 RepID=A0A7T2YML8_9BURK|nr:MULTISPECIES: HK97 family phage prohead protease [Delftia]QPS78605.1 HK97 family phage prohead protease [Delftia lacustris]WEL99686.1 HK97 family phage prohead protease [Delftia tsuruhatensis]WQM82148.1 HK97 family phage prohead protease [Delftia tsuruhatensis]